MVRLETRNLKTFPRKLQAVDATASHARGHRSAVKPEKAAGQVLADAAESGSSPPARAREKDRRGVAGPLLQSRRRTPQAAVASALSRPFGGVSRFSREVSRSGMAGKAFRTLLCGERTERPSKKAPDSIASD